MIFMKIQLEMLMSPIQKWHDTTNFHREIRPSRLGLAWRRVAEVPCERNGGLNLLGGLDFFYFSIYCESSSQLTNIFQRG